MFNWLKPKTVPEPEQAQIAATTQEIVVNPTPDAALVQQEWRLGHITRMFEALAQEGRKLSEARQDEFDGEIMQLLGALRAGGLKQQAADLRTRLSAAGVNV